MQKARQVIQTKQSEVIGTVSITPMGEWNADLNYEKDNYVRHNGATYISRQPNKGIEPGVSQDWGQYWMLSIKDGASATVEVGETTTLPAGEQATVTNSGTNINVVLDFAIPQGEQGLTGTVTVGNTITGQPGTEAVVENAGDEHNAILNFTIPRGEPGEPGNDPNAVHFTQQDLTDVEQQQARENIGAADTVTVEGILSGDKIVGKANADSAGNIITDTYAAKAALEDVVDGTTVVAKATADASGNTITTFYGHSLTMTIDSTTYVVTLSLLDAGGTALSTQTIDLPLESVVVSGSYDADTKEVVLTLQGGSEVRFSVADLVDGLASQSALDAETQARQQADTALGQRIDDLNASDIALSVPNISATNVADGIEELNENINQITGGGVVTGVKGNAETAFRTGQVNLTPENIGAATNTDLQNVINGTTVVGKATADAQGNDISTTYAKTSELGYNTVLYTAAQTLTEEQKAQARANIGAADATGGGGSGNNIANATVTLGASLTFNGAAQEQAITSVTLNGETLAEGVHYKLAGNIATDAGNYVLAVMGIGDYTGTLWVDWSIAKAQGSISVSEQNVLLFDTKEIYVSFNGGYGNIVAQSSNPDVVGVATTGTTIKLYAVSDGNATVSVSTTGNYTASTSFSVTSFIIRTSLEDSTWAGIRYAADNDLGENFWAVGDTKSIALNGTVGTKSYSNVTVWAYILGFNHNADREGEHLIHFGGFKTAQTDGVDICLDDSHYNSASTNGAKWFNVNHWGNYNYGGWSRCDMRFDILGSTDVEPDGYGGSPSSGQEGHDPTSSCATSPVANTLMAALPPDMREVMRPATKYTNNVGGTSVSASNMSATIDYLPLLAEFEVQGEQQYALGYEENYQTQYAYYANGNSKVKYRQTSTGSAADWWCRSPYASNSNYFCYVYTNGSAGNHYANYSLGVSPAFFI